MFNWQEEFNGAITVCDSEMKIVYMNQKSQTTFANYGGSDIIGTDLMTYHNEKSQAKIKEIIETKKVNVYTIEKAGIKKIIYQSPCFENGEFAGLIELSLEIPFDMQHFVRE